MKKTSLRKFFIISAVIAILITVGNMYLLNVSDPMKIYMLIITGVSFFAIILPVLMYIDAKSKKIANKYDLFLALFCIDDLVLLETFVLTFYCATVNQGRLSDSVLHVLQVILYIALFIFVCFIINTIITKTKEIKQQ